MKYITDDTRIAGQEEVIAPADLVEELPVSERSSKVVFEARQQIRDMLRGHDSRLLVIIGPCSIHDPKAALVYAERLHEQAVRFENELLVVMRVYFEKPRTIIGWKGLLNDPHLNDSCDINEGLRRGRALLRDITELGLPSGTEYLDPISPQYLGDTVSWAAIGARTTESQVHRQLASGLSCPVGFKNSTQGDIQIAVDAVRSAWHPHVFLSVTKHGHSAIFSTTGNDDCHVILRGGGGRTNFDADSMDACAERLRSADLPTRLMVDMSHANSEKQYKRQLDVCDALCGYLKEGGQHLMGVMIESNLVEGKQTLEKREDLVFGQSITDACLGWDDSLVCLEKLASAVSARRTAGPSSPPSQSHSDERP